LSFDIHAANGDLRPLDEPEIEPAKPRQDEDGRGLLPLLCVFVTLTVLTSAAALAVTAQAAYLRVPYSDIHDWIGRVFATERDHRWFDYLWRPHGEQRIPIALALTAIDIEVSQGRLPSFLIGTAAAWLLALVALAVAIARSEIAATTKLVLALVTGVLALNVALAEDFAFPVFSVYVLVCGPAIAALTILPMSARSGWRSAGFWVALGVAWLSSCGNAAGLAVWPALISALVLLRTDRKTIGLALAMMVVCIACLEAGLGVPSTTFTGDGGLAHAAKILGYFLVFGALPWSRGLHALPLQVAVGVLIWVAALLVFRRGLRTHRLEPLVVSGMALIVFGLATAVLASLGRVDELPQLIVPTRYTPFAISLQVGIILAASNLANDLRFNRPIAFGAAGSIAATLMLASTPHGMGAIERTADRIRLSSAVFDRTGRDGEIEIHPRPADAAAVRAELARRGLPH